MCLFTKIHGERAEFNKTCQMCCDNQITEHIKAIVKAKDLRFAESVERYEKDGKEYQEQIKKLREDQEKHFKKYCYNISITDKRLLELQSDLKDSKEKIERLEEEIKNTRDEIKTVDMFDLSDYTGHTCDRCKKESNIQWGYFGEAGELIEGLCFRCMIKWFEETEGSGYQMEISELQSEISDYKTEVSDTNKAWKVTSKELAEVQAELVEIREKASQESIGKIMFDERLSGESVAAVVSKHILGQ